MMRVTGVIDCFRWLTLNKGIYTGYTNATYKGSYYIIVALTVTDQFILNRQKICSASNICFSAYRVCSVRSACVALRRYSLVSYARET